jgi:spore maturation protein CgeB
VFCARTTSAAPHCEKSRQKLVRALPNFDVPAVFSRFRLTIHIPRRPYVEAVPGISTIRRFDALACGIPLISSSWNDSESLFTPGRDYVVARVGQDMNRHLMRKGVIERATSARRQSIMMVTKTIATSFTASERRKSAPSIVMDLRACQGRPTAR